MKTVVNFHRASSSFQKLSLVFQLQVVLPSLTFPEGPPKRLVISSPGIDSVFGHGLPPTTVYGTFSITPEGDDVMTGLFTVFGWKLYEYAAGNVYERASKEEMSIARPADSMF
eukprot:764147-Hanusia_phi.AAC.3